MPTRRKEHLMTENLPVAMVTVVDPGTGAAIVRRFARGGYSMAMLARNQERLDALDPVIAVCVPLIWVTA
jgi:NADP-dependent 3-hydroxy acid dehydrogenase YdfG